MTGGTSVGISDPTKEKGEKLKLGEISWDDLLSFIFDILPQPHDLACGHCDTLVFRYDDSTNTGGVAYRMRVEGEWRTKVFCDHRCLIEFVEEAEATDADVTLARSSG